MAKTSSISARLGAASATLAWGILACAGAAHAHAHLVSSSPAANAVGPAPAQIVMKFSEAPTPQFSAIELTPASGAAIALKSMHVADPHTIAVAPVSPLPPGAYSVKWHVVTADTHRTHGAFGFKVR